MKLFDEITLRYSLRVVTHSRSQKQFIASIWKCVYALTEQSAIIPNTNLTKNKISHFLFAPHQVFAINRTHRRRKKNAFRVGITITIIYFDFIKNATLCADEQWKCARERGQQLNASNIFAFDQLI